MRMRQVLPQVGDVVADLPTEGAHGQSLVQLGVGYEGALGAVAAAADVADELAGAGPWKQQRRAIQWLVS